MTGPTAPVAILVPGLDPTSRQFDPSFWPPEIRDLVATAADAATQAVNAAARAVAAAGAAGSDVDASTSAAAAAAAQLAAEKARDAAVTAANAAIAAAASGGGGGGASSAEITQAIANLAAVARTGDYRDLNFKPAVVDSPDDIGALAVSARGAASGVASLDANKRLTYAEAQPGSRFDVFCDNNVQPLRSTLTSRTDIHFDFWKLTDVLTTAGYAQSKDSWIRWNG